MGQLKINENAEWWWNRENQQLERILAEACPSPAMLIAQVPAKQGAIPIPQLPPSPLPPSTHPCCCSAVHTTLLSPDIPGLVL